MGRALTTLCFVILLKVIICESKENIKIVCSRCHFETSYIPTCSNEPNCLDGQTLKVQLNKQNGVGCSYCQIELNKNDTLERNVNAIDMSFLTMDDLGFVWNVYQPHIKLLNVSYNRIKGNYEYDNGKKISFQRKIFNQLPNLTTADFSFNQIKELIVADLERAAHISTLNYSNNGISKIEKGALSSMLDLEILDLSYNHISTFIVTLSSHTKMKELNLRNNSIQTFTFNSIFSANVCPVEVDLSGNEIEILDIGGTSSKCNFNDIHVSFAKIRTFIAPNIGVKNTTKLLDKLETGIQYLDLSSNNIETVTKEMFERFIQLDILYLGQCNISQIEDGSFSNLTNLTKLDLSFNELKQLDAQIFPEHFPKLTTVHLEGNELTKIDGVTQKIFPALTKLGLSSNKFECRYLETFLKQWTNLPTLLTGNFTHNTSNIYGVDCKVVEEKSERNNTQQINEGEIDNNEDNKIDTTPNPNTKEHITHTEQEKSKPNDSLPFIYLGIGVALGVFGTVVVYICFKIILKKCQKERYPDSVHDTPYALSNRSQTDEDVYEIVPFSRSPNNNSHSSNDPQYEPVYESLGEYDKHTRKPKNIVYFNRK